VAAGRGPWRFFGPHLDRAIESWRTDHLPSDEQVAALYDWAAEFVEIGPGGPATLHVGAEDEWITLVGAARVVVTYLAVAQDGLVFVRSIEPAP
jgi:hypothetical protein